MVIRGLHRIKNPDGIGDGVWVTDGTSGFQITETRYQDENYLPSIAGLPWAKPIPGGDTK
jgi:hypothetical protein